MILKLPNPVQKYFAAANDRDIEGIADCFSEQARVKDEGEWLKGKDAIRHWSQLTRDKYDFTSQPTAIDGTDNKLRVTAQVSGNFPGSPVDLRYEFTLRNDLIEELSIA